MTRSRGFTLIEVVIVMAIIAITMGLVGPRIGAGLGRLNLLQAAQTVRLVVKQARIQAERTERQHYVVLNRKARSVALLSSDLKILRQETLPSSVELIMAADSETSTVFVSPSGLLRGPLIRLRGRTGEAEVGLP